MFPDVGIACSFKAEEALQALELFERAIFVVDATSVQNTFAVKKLQIGCNKDSIFFKGSVTDIFAVLDVSDFTINIAFFK